MSDQLVREWINGEEVGEIHLTTHERDADHEHRWLTIEHADPVILASAIGLDFIRAQDPMWSLGARIDGDILKIHAENRTVIYRIMEQAPYRDAYVLRWPD